MRQKPGTIRLWTFQPPHVWAALQKRGTLLVNPSYSDKADDWAEWRVPYDWMREQMAARIPGYQGGYPWWAYEHFLDLRFYRWHHGEYGRPIVRLALEIPREQVLLSAYGAWHAVLNRWYLPCATEATAYENELQSWETEASQAGIDVDSPGPLPEPWESQMRVSWESVFDVEARRATQTIQATFERLELQQVVKATEFVSRNQSFYASSAADVKKTA